MVSFDEVVEKVLENVNEKRYEHCILVSKEAFELAKHYGFDAEKARIVGVAHDIAKEFSNEENEQWIKKYNLDRKLLDDKYRKLVHANVGAVVCKEWFSFSDDMCNAIKYHTIAHYLMSDFDKIIFISDKIGRKDVTDWMEKLKEIAYQSLDEAMIYFLERQEILLKEKGRGLFPETIKLLDNLKNES